MEPRLLKFLTFSKVK